MALVDDELTEGFEFAEISNRFLRQEIGSN